MASFCGILSLTLSLFCTFLLTVHFAAGQSSGAHYRGRYIGPIASKKHGVSGEIFAVDARTIHIRGFNYDGTGPDAFFWTGFTEHPSKQGIIIPNERGTKEVLRAYTNQDITISLPDGLTLRDIKWIAVWCRAYEVNFGDIYIPINLDYPQPHVIGSLVGQYGVSSGPIVVVDAQTLLVPDFTYDGQAPDCHFWVGRGVPGPNGIRVAGETGTDAPLAKADRKTMVLSLPGDLTVFDVDYFGVWCRLYSLDFGHVRVTPGLNVPPSLRMLGVAPQSKLNCEVLHEDSAFEIRWSVVESGDTIVLQLVGRIDSGKYMALGLSGENDRSVMVGGDAMIGWFNQTTGLGNVVDYHLGGKSRCQDSFGSCPDVRLKDGVNNIRLLSAAFVNGFTILTFQRKLKAFDAFYDKQIRTNESQPIIWAIGALQDDIAGYHEFRNRDDISIDFGRSPPKWNCPEPQNESEFADRTPNRTPNRPISTTERVGSSSEIAIKAPAVAVTKEPDTSASDQSGMSLTMTAWRVPPIPCSEPDDGVFYIHLGPIGRKDVFKSVTENMHPPDNVWYVNGLLIPEINLVRNKNYTFVIQGGEENGFYITDSKIGDFQHSKQQAGIFAGVEFDSLGNARPTAVGTKLCRWVESGNNPAEVYTSYAAFQRSLSLECGSKKGHSGVLQFTPDIHTPNLIYYQSFSKPNIGWKIHVLDHCGKDLDNASPGSPTPQILQVDQNIGESNHVNSLYEPSVIVNDMSQQQHNFEMNEMHPPVTPIQQPIQNAYIIDTTMAGSFPNLQQFDSRLIFKGNKPLEPQSQGSHRQSIVALGPGNTFQLQQTPGVYQIAIEPSGDNGARPYQQQQTGFQMPDSHFLRRNGPQQANNYNKYPTPLPPLSYADRMEGYYEAKPKPEYFSGPTRPPLMSIPGRYENQPPMMYATTMAPQRRHGLPFMTHDSSDILMRNPTSPNGPRRPQHENAHVKYLEHPSGSPSIKIMQNDGRYNAPPPWVNTRNLPKRENSKPSKDVSPVLRKSIFREGLRRVTRDFHEPHASKEELQLQQPRQVGISIKNKRNSSEEEGKNFAQTEIGAAQPISMAHEGKNDSETIASHPVLENFFGPTFRPSPPDRQIADFLNQLQQPPLDEPIMSSESDSTPPVSYHFQRGLGTQQPYHFHRLAAPSFSVQQPAWMYRPIKLRLRDLLRQPSLMPMLNPGRVREFVKLSPPNEGSLRQVHKGHKVFQPRNDHIAPQPEHPAFSADPAALERIEYPISNLSSTFVLLDDDDDINSTSETQKKEDEVSERESSNNDNIEEKTDQNQLSLTLLTDVWQIINQQGISIHANNNQPITQKQKQYIPKRVHNYGKPGHQIPPKMIIKGQRRNIIREILGSPFFRMPGSGRGRGLENGNNLRNKDIDMDFVESEESLLTEATTNISNS